MANKARVTFQIAGTAIERITKKLADIDQKAATKALQTGMTAVCQLIAKDAKARVPKRTGLLRKSIGWKIKTYPSKAVIGLIGPRKGYRQQVVGKWINPVKYAHLVEFGRARVVAGQSRKGATKAKLLSDGTQVFGKEVRMVPPRPFLRPAWDANRGKIGAILARHINAAMRAVCAGRTVGAGVGRGSPSLAV